MSARRDEFRHGGNIRQEKMTTRSGVALRPDESNRTDGLNRARARAALAALLALYHLRFHADGEIRRDLVGEAHADRADRLDRPGAGEDRVDRVERVRAAE